MDKKQQPKKEQRISIRFPLDILEAIRLQAREDDRSFNGETIHLIKVALQQKGKEKKDATDISC
jgi:hypothetical protein